MSGVFEGVTTGTPIGLIVENVDQRSRDYPKIKDTLPARPRRLHLPAEVRHPRLSRRRPLVGARDRHARRGRRHRPQVPARATGRRDPGYLAQLGPIRLDVDGSGRHRRQPVLLRRSRAGAGTRGLHGRAAPGGRFHRRAHQRRRQRRAGRASASRCSTSSMRTSPTP